MKLSTIFSIAALALATPNAVSANFAMYEGSIFMVSETDAELTASDTLYLDMIVKDAYNEAHTGGDFTAEVAVVSDLDLVSRRALNENGERKLPNSGGWAGVVQVGGQCYLCGGGRRGLKGGEEQRRQLDDAVVAALLCNKLATGSNSKFHGVSDCQVSLILVE